MHVLIVVSAPRLLVIFSLSEGETVALEIVGKGRGGPCAVTIQGHNSFLYLNSHLGKPDPCKFTHGPQLVSPQTFSCLLPASSTFSGLLFCLASLSPSLSSGFPFLPSLIPSPSLFPSSLNSPLSTSLSALPLQTHPLSPGLTPFTLSTRPFPFLQSCSPSLFQPPFPQVNCTSSPWLWNTNQSPGPCLPYREIWLAGCRRKRCGKSAPLIFPTYPDRLRVSRTMPRKEMCP